MKRIVYLFVLFAFSRVCIADKESLTLQQCFDLTLKKNLSLKPFEHQIRSHDGSIEQAGLGPNPELEFETENVLGTGGLQTFDGAEVTLGIGQTLETGGKRQRRVDLARSEKSISEREYRQAKLEVLYETADLFIDLLSAQEKRAVQQQYDRTSREIYDTIKTSVDAGRDAPMQEMRARVMAAGAQIELNRIERQCSKLRVELARQWSGSEEDFDAVVGNIEELPPIAEQGEAPNAISNHPDIALADGEIARRNEALRLESSLASPDVTIGAGVRYLAEGDDAAFVVGLSIPLPIHNRNQGAVRAAGELVRKAEAERAAKESELNGSLRAAYQTLLQAKEEAQRLKTDIVPSAQQVFDAAREGYRQGKFPSLSVLDARQSLFEFKIQYIEAATVVHKAANEINRLTAGYNALANNQ